MTNAELITELQKHDPTAEIEIVIHQYNKSYPVAYVPIYPVQYPVTPSPHFGSNIVRIDVGLPDNMRTMTLKS